MEATLGAWSKRAHEGSTNAETPTAGGLAAARQPSGSAVEQRDAADEGRLDACGSIIVGKAIVNQGKVVRPSQLIASVGPTVGGTREAS